MIRFIDKGEQENRSICCRSRNVKRKWANNIESEEDGFKASPLKWVDFTPPSSSGKNPFIKKSSEFSFRFYLNVFVSLNSRKSRFTHLITCTANASILIQLLTFLICLRDDKKKRNFLTAKQREDFRSSSCYRDDWAAMWKIFQFAKATLEGKWKRRALVERRKIDFPFA